MNFWFVTLLISCCLGCYVVSCCSFVLYRLHSLLVLNHCHTYQCCTTVFTVVFCFTNESYHFFMLFSPVEWPYADVFPCHLTLFPPSICQKLDVGLPQQVLFFNWIQNLCGVRPPPLLLKATTIASYRVMNG